MKPKDLAALEAKIADLEAQEKTLREEIRRSPTLREDCETVIETFSEIEAFRKEIKDSPEYQEGGFLNRLLGSTRLSDTAQSWLDDAEDKGKSLAVVYLQKHAPNVSSSSEHRFSTDFSRGVEFVCRLAKVLLKLDRERPQRLKDAQKQLESLREKLAAGRRQQDRTQREKALVSRATNKDRERAKVIRPKLAENHDCPYCDGALGDTPHADHIWPIARGGLSTDRNMVMVCESCNSKKRDLTLQQFLKRFGLDREAVEERLTRLGKDL